MLQIPITKLSKRQLNIMFEAVKRQFEIYQIFQETLDSKDYQIKKSCLQELAQIFFDKLARSYKQTTFSVKLREHQAILLVTALNTYKAETPNANDKATAINLVLQLDPQIV